MLKKKKKKKKIMSNEEMSKKEEEGIFLCSLKPTKNFVWKNMQNLWVSVLRGSNLAGSCLYVFEEIEERNWAQQDDWWNQGSFF